MPNPPRSNPSTDPRTAFDAVTPTSVDDDDGDWGSEVLTSPFPPPSATPPPRPLMIASPTPRVEEPATVSWGEPVKFGEIAPLVLAVVSASEVPLPAVKIADDAV